jgi:hypothetical protein
VASGDCMLSIAGLEKDLQFPCCLVPGLIPVSSVVPSCVFVFCP